MAKNPTAAKVAAAPAAAQSTAPAPAAAAQLAQAPAPPKIILNNKLHHTFKVRSVSQTGRRRSGVSFGPEPIEIRSEDFSPRELDAILSDPQLVAVEAE